MSNKRQKRNRKPPLSLPDKCIYWLGFIISFVGILLLYSCFKNLKSLIAFRDPAVVAYTYTNHASSFFSLPLLLYLEISALTLCAMALTDRKPVFGNRKIKYGEAPWAKDCFPLFDSRRKTVYVAPSKKRLRRLLFAVWCVGLILPLLISPLSLFGRDCLCQDNRVTTYNALNMEDAVSYTGEDFSHLTIQTRYVSGYRSADYWKYEIIIEMVDGKKFAFSNRDFDRRDVNNEDICLKTMTGIKKLFSSEAITVNGKEDVDTVAEFVGLNDEQIQILRDLFDL